MTPQRIPGSFILFLLACSLVISTLLACNVLPVSKPSVVIVSPPSGSQFHEGEDVAV